MGLPRTGGHNMLTGSVYVPQALNKDFERCLETCRNFAYAWKGGHIHLSVSRSNRVSALREHWKDATVMLLPLNGVGILKVSKVAIRGSELHLESGLKSHKPLGYSPIVRWEETDLREAVTFAHGTSFGRLVDLMPSNNGKARDSKEGDSH